MKTRYKVLAALVALALMYFLVFEVLGVVGVKVFYASDFLKQCGFWTFGL